LSHLTDSVQRFDDASLRMRGDLTLEMWKAGTADAAERLCLPAVDERALAGLKFSEALPERLATATLAARMVRRLCLFPIIPPWICRGQRPAA